RVARDSLGELDPARWRPPLEQLLRAFVGEVEASLHVDARLANKPEAQVARLDHPGMHRSHRDLIDSFTADLLERERLPLVSKRARRGVLPQRKVIRRPEAMAHQRSRIGMAGGRDAEEIRDFALEPRRGIVE